MGEVSAIIGGGTPDTHNPAYFGGDIAWLTPADLSDYTAKHVSCGARNITQAGYKNSGTNIMPPGSVLFSSRAPIGYVAIAANPICTNQGFKSFVLNGGLVPDFIYYYLQYAKPLAVKLASGTTFLEISGSNAGQIPVAIAPSAEQARIADALDKLFSDLDAAVAALGRVRQKLKLYRASVLKAAVEGALTAEWRKHHPHVEPGSELLKRILAERRRRWEEDQLAKFKVTGQKLSENWKAKYKEPLAPDNVDLIHLPKSWALASMDTMTLRITSGSRDWQQYYGIGSGTFIMAQNVRPGRFDPSIRQPVSPPPNDPSCERSRVEESDLLVTIVGANTGDICRVPQPLSEHYVCQSVALMRPVDRKTAKYLDYYHNAQNGGQMYYRRYIYGAGRPHLSFDQLKVTPVIIPPLDEQEAIVEAVEDHLSMIEHLEADLDAKLRTAQTLRQAILRHAFTGNLVPQDPNDEPASELLKRVATEREARTRDAAAAKRAAKMTNAAWRRRPVKQKQKEQVA
jgi:type I restriction enzyme, S subunit